MPNTFFGLTIGTTGMYAANVGLNTTAHNITNTETEGYTRQVVEKTADTPLKANSSYGMIGTGVAVKSITQQRDEYYDQKYRKANGYEGYYAAEDYYMQAIEDYFNEIQLDGFNKTFDNFAKALQELSKDPSNMTARTQANNFAESFCDYVTAQVTSLEQQQENVNFEIKTMVDSINSYAVQIAGLNKQINTLEVTGGKANDLRDQRNLLIDKLSNIVEVSTYEKTLGYGETGVTEFTVKIGDTTLVDTFEFHTMEIVPREEKFNQSDIDGLYDVVWDSGQNFNGFVNGGRMQSLFEIRDGNNEQYFNGVTTASFGDSTVTVTDTSVNRIEQIHIAEQGIITIGNRNYVYNGFRVTQDTEGKFVYEFTLNEDMKKDVDDIEVMVGQGISYKGIAYYLQQLDEFARVYSKCFNDIHRTGKDLDNNDGLDYFNSRNVVSGENYAFEYSDEELENGIIVSSKTGAYAVEEEDKNYGSYYQMRAKSLCVTDAIYDNPNKFAAATDVVNGIGQNDVVLKLMELKDKTDMFKQGTPSGFLQALIAEIGVDAKKAKNFSKNQESIVSTIQNQRLSVSGVDTDEEAMNLVRLQNTYNLSAKIISTMDEIYDRLINYMGA